ncbi:hypothetical protein VQZ80_004647 [Salmonella enterica]|nr:hypothetical protein [Salmonella enterica]EJJ3975112.1 hypothetical protein [Salmonella enterica]EJJ3984015.1 hypothetical protein [Salmonella enterica]EJJ3998011.1 hypothetical protein [Salmonella enterica]EJJ4131065.1 hypothetical protein [Salmonella enterica]
MEKFSQELLSLDKFLLRVGRFALRAAGIFLLGIIPGIIGFMMTEGLSFAEAALNAVSMAGSQGVHFPPVSTGGKYFIALYGFYLQAVFFVALGVLISPFVHRIIHRWHLDNDATP